MNRGPLETRLRDQWELERRERIEAIRKRRKPAAATAAVAAAAATTSTKRWNPVRDCATLSDDAFGCASHAYRGCVWAPTRRACLSRTGFRGLSWTTIDSNDARRELAIADAIRPAPTRAELAWEGVTSAGSWILQTVADSVSATIAPFVASQAGERSPNWTKIVTVVLLGLMYLAMKWFGIPTALDTATVQSVVMTIVPAVVALSLKIEGLQAVGRALKELTVAMWKGANEVLDRLGVLATAHYEIPRALLAMVVTLVVALMVPAYGMATLGTWAFGEAVSFLVSNYWSVFAEFMAAQSSTFNWTSLPVSWLMSGAVGAMKFVFEGASFSWSEFGSYAAQTLVQAVSRDGLRRLS